MKKIFLPSLISFAVFYLVSCKKDSDNTPAGGNLIGNYKFISLTAATTSTQIVDDGSTVDKTVTRSNYTTTNNTGTLVVDATKMISADLSYSVSTTATADFYEDGVLIDTQDVPFQADIPSSGATSEYKVISSDSLYFPSGSAISGGVVASSDPGGCKYRFEADKLILTVNGEKTTQQSQAGVSITSINKANVIATYQKQ